MPRGVSLNNTCPQGRAFIRRLLEISIYFHDRCFYPRDAMLARVLAVVVCLSVCHTPVFYQNG